MPEPIIREYGRKPYIDPGKGQDGGYVNAMRRTTQQQQGTARAEWATSGRTIFQHDSPGAVITPGLIHDTVLPIASWGIAFDATGGVYATYAYTIRDIYYRPAGGVFAPLGVTVGNGEWSDCFVAPDGSVYALCFANGIYKRTGGVGDFAAFDVALWSNFCVALNGDIYAIKSNQIYKWDGSTFVSLAQPTRGYKGMCGAANGDIYVTVYDTGKIYIRVGGVGDFVELPDTIPYANRMSAAANGNIFLTQYQDPYCNVWVRAGGAGLFTVYFDMSPRYVQWHTVSPISGLLYLSHSYYEDFRLGYINTVTSVPPPKDTISQTHAVPLIKEEPLYKNRKPYQNKSYAEMMHFDKPIDHTGTERQPETAGAKPILVDHIPPVHFYVRDGSPVVVDIPTTLEDPISRVEVLSGDGFASVAPNGISVIYKPGPGNAAVLVVHTKSGQQCSVNLMAKV